MVGHSKQDISIYWSEMATRKIMELEACSVGKEEKWGYELIGIPPYAISC